MSEGSSPSQARELARDVLRKVAVGEDPQAEKSANRQVSSLTPGAGRVTGVYDRSKRVREVAPWLSAWAAYVDSVATGQESSADLAGGPGLDPGLIATSALGAPLSASPSE